MSNDPGKQMFVLFRWIIPVVAVGTFILVTFLTMHIIQYTKYRVTQKSVITDRQQTSDKKSRLNRIKRCSLHELSSNLTSEDNS